MPILTLTLSLMRRRIFLIKVTKYLCLTRYISLSINWRVMPTLISVLNIRAWLKSSFQESKMSRLSTLRKSRNLFWKLKLKISKCVKVKKSSTKAKIFLKILFPKSLTWKATRTNYHQKGQSFIIQSSLRNIKHLRTSKPLSNSPIKRLLNLSLPFLTKEGYHLWRK